MLEEGVRKVPLLGRVLPREQSLGVVYFDVKGPWADPHVSVAPIKTLGQSVVDPSPARPRSGPAAAPAVGGTLTG